MNRLPGMVIDFGHVMDLGMAVMAGRDAVLSLGGQNLVGLGLAVSPALLLETGLQVSATAAAAEVIGTVGGHVDKVFFTYHCLDHIPQIFGHRIAKGFTDQLAGILDGEFNLSFLVPFRRRLQFAFLDPLGIELDNGLNFKVVGDVELLQSYQDCE